MSESGPTADQVKRAARLLPARIAGQSGLLTAAQAVEAGQTLEHLRWMVESGRWTRLHRGVYLTTPGRDDWEVHAVAALLAVGGSCALTGPSAGKAWGLTPDTGWDLAEGRHMSVVVPFARRGLSRPGISVTRSRSFGQRVDQDAWPHRITAEHTVFDLASGDDPERMLALMAKACQRGAATEASLATALAQRPRQRHRRIACEVLGLVGEGAESAAELRYVRDVEAAHDLPRGVRQAAAPGNRRRDTAYPEYGVVVEIDGRLGHVGWIAQRRDNRRDRKAATQGELTVRGGWPDVSVDRCEFAQDVGEILALRGWTGHPAPCADPRCLIRRRAA